MPDLRAQVFDLSEPAAGDGGYADRNPEDVAVASSDSHMLQNSDGESTWDALTGKLIAGEGVPLRPAPFLISYGFAWRNFDPHTRIVDVP